MIPAEAFWTIETIRDAFANNEPIERIRHMLLVVGRRSMESSEQDKVQELLAARWTPNFEGDPYQWQWRRPGKRPGKPGRLFLSTGQAHSALKREANK